MDRKVKREFSKYRKWGDYHWRFYSKGTKYKPHADKVKNWVKEKKVLDIGAGDGLITWLMGAVGIDNDTYGLQIAKDKGVDVRNGDAYELPFSDDEFEAATMLDVIEHFEFPDKALAEARRVAPVLYVTTPIKDIEPGKMDRHHWREWLPEELKEYVESQGYRLEGTIDTLHKTQYAKFVRV